MTKPRRGEFYTARQIFELDLNDTPCLMVPIPKKFGFEGQAPIQDPDMGWEKALEIMGDVVFRYQQTTHEMIPVFIFEDDPIVAEQCLDIELDLVPYGNGPGCWVLPKGDTRPQDYRWDEKGVSLISDFSDSEPAPQWLVDAYNHLNQK